MTSDMGLGARISETTRNVWRSGSTISVKEGDLTRSDISIQPGRYKDFMMYEIESKTYDEVLPYIPYGETFVDASVTDVVSTDEEGADEIMPDAHRINIDVAA